MLSYYEARPKPDAFPEALWALLQEDLDRQFASVHFFTLSQVDQSRLQSLLGLYQTTRHPHALGNWHPAVQKKNWSAVEGGEEARTALAMGWGQMQDLDRALCMLRWNMDMFALRLKSRTKSLQDIRESKPVAGTVGSSLYM